MKSTLVIRQAVRPWLERCGAGENILIAVSGGADSLALAACLARESHELAINLSPIIIDHRLRTHVGIHHHLHDNPQPCYLKKFDRACTGLPNLPLIMLHHFFTSDQ